MTTITQIMAEHGIIPAETLDPVAATTTPTVGERLIKSAKQAREMAASGDLPGTMQGGSANITTTPDLIEREAAVRSARGDIRIVAAIRALPAAQPAQRVKPLAWDGGDVAEALGLRYLLTDPSQSADTRGWYVLEETTNTVIGADADGSPEAAKAAAQADYEARVLSALEPATQDGAEVEAMRDALSEQERYLHEAEALRAERDALKAEVGRLRAAASLALEAKGKMLRTHPPQDAWDAWQVEDKIRAALRAHEQGEG